MPGINGRSIARSMATQFFKLTLFVLFEDLGLFVCEFQSGMAIACC